jgi:hypothetical protein
MTQWPPPQPKSKTYSGGVSNWCIVKLPQHPTINIWCQTSLFSASDTQNYGCQCYLQVDQVQRIFQRIHDLAVLPISDFALHKLLFYVSGHDVGWRGFKLRMSKGIRAILMCRNEWDQFYLCRNSGRQGLLGKVGRRYIKGLSVPR